LTSKHVTLTWRDAAPDGQERTATLLVTPSLLTDGQGTILLDIKVAGILTKGSLNDSSEEFLNFPVTRSCTMLLMTSDGFWPLGSKSTGESSTR
jgi:hypothetical protein